MREAEGGCSSGHLFSVCVRRPSLSHRLRYKLVGAYVYTHNTAKQSRSARQFHQHTAHKSTHNSQPTLWHRAYAQAGGLKEILHTRASASGMRGMCVCLVVLYSMLYYTTLSLCAATQ